MVLKVDPKKLKDIKEDKKRLKKIEEQWEIEENWRRF